MTKKQQLTSNRIKPKKESTFGTSSKGSFGSKPSKGSFGKKASNGKFGSKASSGSFGKKPSNGSFGKNPSSGEFGKKPSVLKAKPKAKKSELPYLNWLHEASQMSRFTCMVCGVNVEDWHHVKRDSTDKKDHKRLIPLCKTHHTLGTPSPHASPKLWRETYPMERQYEIADAIYSEFLKEQETISLSQ